MTCYIKSFLVLMLVVSLNAFSEQSTEASKLYITNGMGDNHIYANVGRAILVRCYNRIGINIEIVDVPMDRMLKTVLDDKADAALFSNFTTAQEYSESLELINVPLFSLNIIAAYLDDSVNISSIDDLKNYSTAILQGTKSFEKILESVGADFQTVTNIQSTIDMMIYGRVDYFLHSQYEFDSILRRIPKDIAPDIHLTDPILSIDLYHIIHKKHAHLAPLIESELLSMQASGEMQNIIDDVIKSYQK